MARKYKTVSCHTTKRMADGKKKKMHKSGKTARVVKKKTTKGVRYCVLSAGKRKK